MIPGMLTPQSRLKAFSLRLLDRHGVPLRAPQARNLLSPARQRWAKANASQTIKSAFLSASQ
jgi:hypothetical protein